MWAASHATCTAVSGFTGVDTVPLKSMHLPTSDGGSVSGSSGRQRQTLEYIAECEAKLEKLSPHSGRRRSLERQIKHQQQMRQREQELEDQLR